MDIAARQQVANNMDKEGIFAYRKWELVREHPVFTEMDEYMRSDEALNRIEAVLGLSKGALMPRLKDMFVTNYDKGDFLSAHNDYHAGNFAFVASLTHGPAWKESYGGNLEFQCKLSKLNARATNVFSTRWCENVPPVFNTLVLFKTKQPGAGNQFSGPFHKVNGVTSAAPESFRRFGATGWLVTHEDKHLMFKEMPPVTQIEGKPALNDGHTPDGAC